MDRLPVLILTLAACSAAVDPPAHRLSRDGEVALDAVDGPDTAGAAGLDRAGAPAPDAGGPADAPDPADSGAEEPDDAASFQADAAPPPPPDLDRDGLPDARESEIADAYLPYLSIHPRESCPVGGIVYRLRPHPSDPRLLHLIAAHVFERDCGASGHVGDSEVFGATIDPRVPPPDGVLALRAIAHQNTVCERIGDCGRCGGLPACDSAMRRGRPAPVVYYSKDKHGGYLRPRDCNLGCFVTNFCTLAPAPEEPMLVNAGEPGAPLTRDLTAAGLITEARGWTEPSLFHFDPWGTVELGEGGVVAMDLVDEAFLTPVCTP